MWRTLSEANRPWPVLCDDDVIDYMVMEAVAMKVADENKNQAKESEKSAWRKDRSPALEALK
jgi:hypothetical protein